MDSGMFLRIAGGLLDCLCTYSGMFHPFAPNGELKSITVISHCCLCIFFHTAFNVLKFCPINLYSQCLLNIFRIRLRNAMSNIFLFFSVNLSVVLNWTSLDYVPLCQTVFVWFLEKKTIVGSFCAGCLGRPRHNSGWVSLFSSSFFLGSTQMATFFKDSRILRVRARPRVVWIFFAWAKYGGLRIRSNRAINSLHKLPLSRDFNKNTLKSFPYHGLIFTSLTECELRKQIAQICCFIILVILHFLFSWYYTSRSYLM